MPKSLADGKLKVTFLTVKPADPAAPTVAELNAGIDASCAILDSDFTWTAADSDKFNENALCEDANVNSLGRSNYTVGFTAFKYFDSTTKNSHATEDKLLAAVAEKGTTLWGYVRQTAKKSTEGWAVDDEIYLGGEVLTDELQQPSDMGGYTKRRCPLEMQVAYPNIKAHAGGSSSSSSSSSSSN